MSSAGHKKGIILSTSDTCRYSEIGLMELQIYLLHVFKGGVTTE